MFSSARIKDVGLVHQWRLIIQVNNVSIAIIKTKFSLYFSILVHYVVVSIEVIDGRSGYFKVVCTSFGGRPLLLSLIRPSGEPQDVIDGIVEVGEVQGLGNDSFAADCSLVNGSNGDIYSCTASNVVSHFSSNTTLIGMLGLVIIKCH